MREILFVAIGLGAGTLSGLLGVGGGLIIVPALVFLARVDMHVAIGTSLAVIIPTAVVGTWGHAVRHNVDWRIGALVAVGAIAGARISPGLAAAAPTVLLKRIFAVLLILTAIQMLRPGR